MINKDNQYFYFALVGQNFHINYFSSKDNNLNYQKKYLMPDTLGNNLNLVIPFIFPSVNFMSTLWTMFPRDI